MLLPRFDYGEPSTIMETGQMMAEFCTTAKVLAIKAYKKKMDEVQLAGWQDDPPVEARKMECVNETDTT